MKSSLRLKQDAFAGEFLEKNWPDEWPGIWTPEEVAFYERLLVEWQEEIDGAIEDRWHELKERTDPQREMREHEQEAAGVRREAIANR